MTFGKRIAALRKERGWSQKDLGEILDMGPVTLHRYENDQIIPSVMVAARIAEALGVTIDFLVNGEKEGADTTNERLAAFEKLDARDQECVLAVLEAFVKKGRLEEILRK